MDILQAQSVAARLVWAFEKFLLAPLFELSFEGVAVSAGVGVSSGSGLVLAPLRHLNPQTLNPKPQNPKTLNPTTSKRKP